MPLGCDLTFNLIVSCSPWGRGGGGGGGGGGVPIKVSCRWSLVKGDGQFESRLDARIIFRNLQLLDLAREVFRESSFCVCSI